MSLSSAINAAIRVAKSKLSDVVGQGTYRQFVERIYVAGKYTSVYNDIPVDYAPDRFSFQETQDADYQLADAKVIVFNTNNVISHNSVNDVFVMDGTEYKIYKAIDTKVGNFRPVVTIFLRK